MNCYLDIETIPSGETIDLVTLQPPGNISKPETIAAWYKDKAPSIAEEKYRARALDSMAGEILCIGYAFNDGDPNVYIGYELSVISCFADKIKDQSQGWAQTITFVGWNIASFDIPFIWRKAIKYGLTELRNAFNRDRYRGNYIDLMNVWGSDFKDMRKMADVASFLGLLGKMGDITGATVYDAYKSGRIDDIAAYCKSDVETVREIYRKIYE